MIPTLLYVAGFHFEQRDFKRLGAEELAHRFPVQILDCSTWVQPDIHRPDPGTPGRVDVGSHEALVQELDRLDGPAVAFDYMSDWPEGMAIRQELRRRNIPRIVYVSGVVPPPSKPRLFVRVREALHLPALSGKFSARLARIFARPQSAQLSDAPPEVAILSGHAGARSPLIQAKTCIWAHTLDFETALRLGAPKPPEQPYAVFIDEDMIHHPDYAFCKVRPPTTAKRYYPALQRVFDSLEEQTGLKVIIAAHPRAYLDQNPPSFGARTIVAGRTAELIRDAALVLSHASTSQSFTVIWRKPLLLLTSQDLDNSWMGCHITARAEYLGRPVVDIDNFDSTALSPDRWNQIDDVLYTEYQRQFICTPDSLGRPLWPYLAKFLETESSLYGRTPEPYQPAR